MFGKVKEETREEITKRLKEAAEKGIAPKDVVGFKQIEENKNDSMKTHPHYTLVKEICMELAKSGNQLSLASFEFDKRTYDSALIYVRSNDGTYMGCISLYVNMKGESFRHSKDARFIELHLENRVKTGALFHMIQCPPCIEINSKVALPQDPPEWLIICANVLKKYPQIVEEPEWVTKYPDAKKYVNAMF